MTAVMPKSLRLAASAAVLLFALTQLIGPEVAQAQARPRVAVIQLENRAGWPGETRVPEQDSVCA